MRQNETSRLIGVAVATLGLAASASASVTHGAWGSNSMQMRAASISSPVGNAFRTALSTVESRVFNNPSECWIDQTFDDASVSFDNGQSEVWFTADSSVSPAETFWWYGFWGIDVVEADTVFYNGIAYTTSMNKTSLTSYGGASRPFQTTALHEYGHACGLDHEDDEYNIMGQDWTHILCNGSTCRSYLGEDACDGLVSLYGRASGGSFEDVSATVFRWSGRSGEYSTHALGVVRTNAGAVVASTAFEGQRRYNVSRNTTYKFEFTFENSGETTQSPHVGFYLSSNSTISTGDRLLATRTPTISRDNVYETDQSIIIPNDLVSGTTWYLGVIMDDNGTLSEVDESNNAAYHIIQIN